jgi:uncharacterized protein (AIM24 family)
MAEFKVHKLEGMQYVDIHLQEETVRAEAGALNYFTGDISIHSHVFPSLRSVVKSLLADEAIYRPTYTGTGVVTLEASLGGYHILELHGESWILERGTYWASDGDVDVSFHREKVLTSIKAGEGPVYLQTRVSGRGKVALTTRGPVTEVTLASGQSMVAEGRSVIARSPEVSFRMQRPTRNLLGLVTAREGWWIKAFRGPGKILLNPRPHWRYWVLVQRRGELDRPSQASF